jgi:mannose/cellobiose epimerase-like protein (N-acyl-D-glucosamine 2-epimerase family)
MKTRVLLVSIVPPRNDCGVRTVMHRQLVERSFCSYFALKGLYAAVSDEVRSESISLNHAHSFSGMACAGGHWFGKKRLMAKWYRSKQRRSGEFRVDSK